MPFCAMGCKVVSWGGGVRCGTAEGTFSWVGIGDGAWVHPVWFEVESVILNCSGEDFDNLAYPEWKRSGLNIHLEVVIVVLDDGGEGVVCEGTKGVGE